MKFVVIIFIFFISIQSSFSRDFIETTGDFVQIALPSAAFTSSLFENKFINEYTCSFVTTNILVYATKFSVDKKRPNGGKHSFPSGHTAAAFQAASFIDLKYGHEWGIPAYALAGFVGWSRVYAKKHYWEDVFAGAAIGVAVSYFFNSEYHRLSTCNRDFFGQQEVSLKYSLRF